jgi:16S rRNA (cytidine1402-2'-O)-methyltransferase
LGFPPRKRTKRLKFLGQVAEETKTLIFYESPKRMPELLGDLQTVMGERRAVLSREMTKTYEEFMRGTLKQIAGDVEKRKELKGECTLLVEGGHKKEVSPEALRNIIARELAQGNEGSSVLSRRIADQYHLPKKKVYAEILKIKNRES